jgi:hypothetical protein
VSQHGAGHIQAGFPLQLQSAQVPQLVRVLMGDVFRFGLTSVVALDGLGDRVAVGLRGVALAQLPLRSPLPSTAAPCSCAPASAALGTRLRHRRARTGTPRRSASSGAG